MEQELYNQSRTTVSNTNFVKQPVGPHGDRPPVDVDPVEAWGSEDVWPDHNHTAMMDGDEGLAFFTAAPVGDWIMLLLFCIGALLIDTLIFRRLPDSLMCHCFTVLLWLVVAVIYARLTWSRSGPRAAISWATGYLLEWMLSLDNLFVFHLVIDCYKCPKSQIHKALFVGIIGAVVMRLVFFMVVSTLLRAFGWFRWPFGLLLVWSGIEAARSEDDDDDISETRMVRAMKWCLGSRLMEDYSSEGPNCFVRDPEDGRLKATVLLLVVFCLEVSDILFALDSVSAKIAQIPDQYIAFSSTVIAMFGLRSMFFIIKDLVEMFEFLKYGLCIILIFIGVELMFSRFLHLASSTVCILIVAIFVVCIIASIAAQRVQGEHFSSLTSCVQRVLPPICHKKEKDKEGTEAAMNDKLVVNSR
jgi:tellurite resistance protein TerC